MSAAKRHEYGTLDDDVATALAWQFADVGVIAVWERDGTTDDFDLILTFPSERKFRVSRCADDWGSRAFPQVEELTDADR